MIAVAAVAVAVAFVVAVVAVEGTRAEGHGRHHLGYGGGRAFFLLAPSPAVAAVEASVPARTIR